MSDDLLTSATRARKGLLGTFFFMGVVSMAWVARIPEIRDANGLNNGQLGLILISSTVGAILGAQLTGASCTPMELKQLFVLQSSLCPLAWF